MWEAIQNFLRYIRAERGAAANTILSYERDLRKMCSYMEAQGICTADRVTSTALNAYILQMESQGMSAATISRTVTTLKRFFDFLCKHEGRRDDPAELLKAPRVERKKVRTAESSVLSRLKQMAAEDEKQLRDKAMMLALCRGVRASEVISLRLEDVNLEFGYLRLQGGRQSRTLSMGEDLPAALREYLEKGRPALLRGRESESVFVNCLGGPLSRQSVWKIVRHYGQQAGISGLTPDGLRLAAHAD